MPNNILDTLNPSHLGKQLQQARKQRGLTQEEAAKVIDVARTTLVAIEKGERRLKSSELVKLARAYGRHVSDFVRQTPIIESFDVQFRSAFRRSEAEEAEIQPVIFRFQELITEGSFARFLGVDLLEARRIAEILREPSREFKEDMKDQNLAKGE